MTSIRGAVKKKQQKSNISDLYKTGNNNIKGWKTYTYQIMVGKQRLDSIICHGIRLNLKKNEM
jgi:hypothetical protein